MGKKQVGGKGDAKRKLEVSPLGIRDGQRKKEGKWNQNYRRDKDSWSGVGGGVASGKNKDCQNREKDGRYNFNSRRKNTRRRERVTRE